MNEDMENCESLLSDIKANVGVSAENSEEIIMRLTNIETCLKGIYDFVKTLEVANNV